MDSGYAGLTEGKIVVAGGYEGGKMAEAMDLEVLEWVETQGMYL